jgi:hypothetical protein
MARSNASMWWRMTLSARGASPSQIACSRSACSVSASSSRATRSSARNQIRSVSV